MPAILLFILGLCLGSFVNALVWRVHEQARSKKRAKDERLSILKGRSMCPHCSHELAPRDLIPIVSWLTLRGRCRYCEKSISSQYPLVELIGGLIFALSFAFWPSNIHNSGNIILLITWIVSSVGLLSLAVYDLKWKLLPNRIIYPTVLISWVGELSWIILYATNKTQQLLLFALSIAVAAGFFYLLYEFSQGKWIGFGDVRLGLITGALLHDPLKSFLMIFIASVLGTLFVLPDIVKGKKGMASELPYGPYLIAATGLIVLFGDSLISWYKTLVHLS